MKRLFSAVLSAALLISLCACDPSETVESNHLPASGRPNHTPDSSEAPVEYSFFPEPTSSLPPEYDSSYRLEESIPPLINGLEMPISGATGYTSVELPLWPSIPEEDKDPESTDSSEPEPSAGEPPAADSPEPTAPVETEGPAPDDPVASDPTPETPTDVVEEAELLAAAPEETTPEPEPTEMPPLVTLPSTEIPDPTETPTPEPTPTPTPEPEPTETPDPYAEAVAIWEPGTAFVIIKEDGDWWYVSRGDETGWIEHCYCMINLPDVIPSMIYDDTNSYSSLFVSCGKEIPGVTGNSFYNSSTYNVRLDKQEFIMPILYAAARHICAAQHRALAEGNCLVVYQTFRPYDTQIAVVNAMSKLAKADPEVRTGISTSPWSMTWFISTGISNYQRGYALDVSMVKVYGTETQYIGSYPYLSVTDYAYYKMPTAMHELSIAAISTVAPGSSKLSETMNEPAIALREYFTSSGLSPLASEWWHFNDNTAMRAASAKPSNGRYFVTECMSRLPG